MLKNTDGLLPLDGSVKTIAVIGPNANSTLTLVGNYYGCHMAGGPLLANCTFVTPLQGLQAAGVKHSIKVTYTKGCDVESTNTSDFAAAVKLASEV